MHSSVISNNNNINSNNTNCVLAQYNHNNKTTVIRAKAGYKWKRNMELAEKSWFESWNGSHVMCCARTANSNKLCETQDT